MIKKCSICGAPIHGIRIITDNKKAVCVCCTNILSYCTKNDKSIKTPTKKGTRYGFELECVARGNLKVDIANVVAMGYDILPTYDGSLPVNGVEFKTPIMNSLRGAETMLNKINKYFNFTSKKCGQHINMSNPRFTSRLQNIIVEHPKFLKDFAAYLDTIPLLTRKICGRALGESMYAGIEYSYMSHTSWINLSHDGRVEFRCSKLRTPHQYILLVHMWEEIFNVMIDFAEHYKKTFQENSEVYTRKCIRIFDRYVKKISTTGVNSRVSNS